MEKILFFLALISIGIGAGLILSILLSLITVLFKKKSVLNIDTSIITGLIIFLASILIIEARQEIKIYAFIGIGAILGSLMVFFYTYKK